MTDYRQILEGGSATQKIDALEHLSETADPDIVELVIDRLSDDSIQVRGEAFAALVSNDADIADIIAGRLDSEDRNVRAYCTLVLANRRDESAAGRMLELTRDPDRSVRQCAMGALGFLRSPLARDAIHERVRDDDIEVKKSAVQAAIDMGESLTTEEVEEVLSGADDELIGLVAKLEAEFSLKPD